MINLQCSIEFLYIYKSINACLETGTIFSKMNFNNSRDLNSNKINRGSRSTVTFVYLGPIIATRFPVAAWPDTTIHITISINSLSITKLHEID